MIIGSIDAESFAKIPTNTDLYQHWNTFCVLLLSNF